MVNQNRMKNFNPIIVLFLTAASAVDIADNLSFQSYYSLIFNIF